MSGCGCKGQQQQTSKTQRQIIVNGVTEILEQPTYTREQLTRVENWLTSTNKTKEDTDFVHNFNHQQFGEIINGYCDIPCQHRIRRRVEHLKHKLELYERS